MSHDPRHPMFAAVDRRSTAPQSSRTANGPWRTSFDRHKSSCHRHRSSSWPSSETALNRRIHSAESHPRTTHEPHPFPLRAWCTRLAECELAVRAAHRPRRRGDMVVAALPPDGALRLVECGPHSSVPAVWLHIPAGCGRFRACAATIETGSAHRSFRACRRGRST